MYVTDIWTLGREEMNFDGGVWSKRQNLRIAVEIKKKEEHREIECQPQK